MKGKASASVLCACGTQQRYEQCCGPWHNNTTDAYPDNAETLMRSRYSAFVLHQWNYLENTWHPSTRPSSVSDNDPPKWLGLSIKQHQQLSPTQARVEFIARYKIGSRAYRLHEISNFILENGRWYYVDGIFPTEQQ